LKLTRPQFCRDRALWRPEGATATEYPLEQKSLLFGFNTYQSTYKTTEIVAAPKVYVFDMTTAWFSIAISLFDSLSTTRQIIIFVLLLSTAKPLRNSLSYLLLCNRPRDHEGQIILKRRGKPAIKARILP
jgi:hypothetical protein